MNTPVDKIFIDAASNRHLDWLESEAIHIMREVAGEFERPALLFSGGKDSICLLRLAEKAFRPSDIPMPFLNVDTGHHFPELNEFRDRRAAQLGARELLTDVSCDVVPIDANAVGDVVQVRERSRNMALVLEALQSAERDTPDYIEVDAKAMSARFVRTPELAEVPYPVKMEPNLVVEFYAS